MQNHSMERNFPWLVQRLRTHINDEPNLSAKGIDREFRLDYMGSAEFEFGSIPHTLKLMRANDGKLVKVEKIEFDGKKGYFLGLKEDLALATAFFENQLGPNPYRLKEPTRMSDVYKATKKDYYTDIIGWWAITEKYSPSPSGYNLPFAIFKTDEAARKFKKGVWPS